MNIHQIVDAWESSALPEDIDTLLSYDKTVKLEILEAKNNFQHGVTQHVKSHYLAQIGLYTMVEAQIGALLEMIQGYGKKPTDFEVMGIMANKDMDLTMLPSFVRADWNKKGGTISMGVPTETFNKFCSHSDQYIPVLYLINREEFTSIKDGKVKP